MHLPGIWDAAFLEVGEETALVRKYPALGDG
jgi:hypothetical protein